MEVRFLAMSWGRGRRPRVAEAQFLAREDVKQVVSAVVERREVEEAAVSGAEEQAKRRAAVLVEAGVEISSKQP